MECLEHLPNGPAPVQTVLELMEPPRQLNYIDPLLHDGTKDCVAAYGEKDGTAIGIGYTGDSWERVGPELHDIDAFFHDDPTVNQFVQDVATAVENELTLVTQTYTGDLYHMAPPGLQSKSCIRHRPLSDSDLTALKRWPQIATVETVCHAHGNGVVGVAIVERAIDEIDSLVFMWYHPNLGTWRIVDITTPAADDSTIKHIQSETVEKADQHYDTIKR